MQISVAGKQIDLSDALKHRVTAHLDRLADKFFDRALDAQVTFSRARSFFTCDINLHAARGLTLRGEGEAADAHGAFDDAAEHIARRLRRYRERVNDHIRTLPRRKTPEVGRSYILRPAESDGRVRGEAMHDTGPYATIVAERAAEIATLSVSEAVMRLDLAASTLLMFRNSTSDQINVIYRRQDGNIGWLDPSPA
ncbi:sigma 54 modulation protein/ribosomal protein S30EA [Gluconacetobacter diazotrophicus PA1 5]|uniref:Ribosome hibernation promoting factor n=2 Tax=Gluconacetobacter diazotrophicus TaxID=33996 RepID=A9HKN3_GLUDA|nr:ribosome-associated translation inhibitor RaiA [Gluconacetobacter diazotrophicus]ACI50135.1 sigma 54 modulation protein/ribosomal protein S30EA [Gluconacetobacter diazotrophicus PA1 5]MBB2154944.1 ribosome-associated translation inhibitor RaiA [Gluconacetobacter diazotrophicus]TWB08106.1 SSU ribosomal protein S30P /sigma 54 modulation protein [Gluconacetobacter diazotrophicus]CAP56063.1 Sigma(54) modulation protein [Gluconacetobacter diazotrophicus PA1 5]